MALTDRGISGGGPPDGNLPIVGTLTMSSALPTPPGSQSSFQFIGVSQNDSPELRSRNRTIARSHVMKTIRRGQKRSTEQGGTTSSPRPKNSRLIQENQIAELLRRRNHTEQDALVARTSVLDQAFSHQLRQNINSSYASGSLRMEADLNFDPRFMRKWTPLAFEMMNHNLKVIWPLFWPAMSSEEPNPMVMAWWQMYRTSPILFHASTHSAAAHLDSLRSSTALTTTTEALAHKTTAIRLINEEVSRLQMEGGMPSDDLMMAVLSMTSEVDDDLLTASHGATPQFASPFKPPLMSTQWERQFTNIRSAKFHENALYTLMRMRGSIENIKNICLAKSMCQSVIPLLNDCRQIELLELLTAALDLKKPEFAFFDAPNIIALSKNPMLNVLMVAMDEQRGWALPSLLSCGLTEQALKVLLDLQHISVIIEAYTSGALQTPDVLALTCRRNSIHHALFSLPTADEVEMLTEDQKAMYESCRVAALIYDLSIIFPVPPVTGVVARLVAKAKATLQMMRLEAMLGAGVKAITWVLFMAGAAAESMPERRWFVEKLRLVLVSESTYQWDTVREILNSYLWMSSAMDDAAVRLWHEISTID